MEKECRFLKSLDRLQDSWDEESKKAENNEDRIEINTRMIACLLGIYIEHELDKCKDKKHNN